MVIPIVELIWKWLLEPFHSFWIALALPLITVNFLPSIPLYPWRNFSKWEINMISYKIFTVIRRPLGHLHPYNIRQIALRCTYPSSDSFISWISTSYQMPRKEFAVSLIFPRFHFLRLDETGRGNFLKDLTFLAQKH